jgi:carboxypeptidase C (cathepsin A)
MSALGLHSQFLWRGGNGKPLSDYRRLCKLYKSFPQVDALNTQFSAIYHAQQFAPYTVLGQTTGQYKNAGTFSYVRIYGAGHEVPAYRVRVSAVLS